jgi:preprotein translocase SecE subunit
MSNFLKESLEELDHVVWPTNVESRKYMAYTIGTIVVVATLLAIAGYLLSGGMSGLRAQFPHAPLVTDTATGSDMVTEADLAKLQEAVEAKKKALSGAQIQVE